MSRHGTDAVNREPGTTSWMRTEAVVAGRLLVLGVALFAAIWLALQIRVITVAAFIAFAQAALLWPVHSRLRRYLSNPLSAFVVVALYASLIGVLIWVILVQIVESWPVLANAVLGSIDSANDWFLERGWTVPPDIIDTVQSEAQARLGQVFSGLSGAALSGIGVVGNVTTVLVVATFATLFALIGGRSLVESLCSMAPESRRASMETALRRSTSTARWWMLAATVTGLVDGVLIGLGMYVMDIPLAVPIGMATFILGFLPMIGATIAGAVAVAVALFFGGVSSAIAVLLLVLVVQQIEGNVLSPLLLSRAMQFPPLVTLLGATAGGAAYGVTGLFLTVPVAGILTAAVKGWRSPETSVPDAAEHPDDPDDEPPGGAPKGDRGEPEDDGTPGDDPGNDDGRPGAAKAGEPVGENLTGRDPVGEDPAGT